MPAITFPLDLIESGIFWCRSYRLAYRQELSRVAGGNTIRKNLGRPLWRAEYSTKTLKPNGIARIRAMVDTVNGGIFTFRGVNPERCRPIRYPSNGAWFDGFSGSGSISQVYQDNKRVDVGGMPEGYEFSVGDFIMIGEGRLYMIAKGAVASSGGVASDIEVRPWLYTGTAVGDAVGVIRPYCNMAINPDEISESVDVSTGRGTYSFTAWEIPQHYQRIPQT